MATWADVSRVARGLPETVEDHRSWRVGGKLIAWERPLRPKDLAELGDAAPADAPLGVRVPDVGAKDALVAAEPDVYFTTTHFHGYPAVLVRLDRLPVPELTELLTEAWLTRAPKRLAQQWLAGQS
jgi:hypothetical protein